MRRQIDEGVDRRRDPVPMPDTADGELQTAIVTMRKVDLHGLALSVASSMSPQDKAEFAEQLAALANACLDARNVLLPKPVRR